MGWERKRWGRMGRYGMVRYRMGRNRMRRDRMGINGTERHKGVEWENICWTGVDIEIISYALNRLYESIYMHHL